MAFHLRKCPEAEHHTEPGQEPAVPALPAIQAFEVRHRS